MDISLEHLIDNQSEDKVEGLLDIVSELKTEILFGEKDGKKLEATHGKKLEEELLEVFGVNADITFADDYYNFGVFQPNFGGYSSIQTKKFKFKTLPTEPELRKLVLDNREIFKSKPGKVDYKRAYLSGAFSEMKSKIVLNPIAFLPIMKTEVFLAAILHEVGHIFGFFSSLGRTRRVMSVLHDVMLDVISSDKKDRLKVLKTTLLETTRTGELPKESVDKILNNETDDVYAIMGDINKLAISAIRDEYDDVPTNSMFTRIHMVENEANADIFVARLGMGRYIYEFLDLVRGNKGVFSKANQNIEILESIDSVTMVTRSTISVLTGVLGISFGVSLSMILGLITAWVGVSLIGVLTRAYKSSLAGSASDFTYDNEPKRLRAMANEMTRRLRWLHKSSLDNKAEIVRELRVLKNIDEVIKDLTVKDSLLTTLTNFALPSARKIRRSMDMRDVMENLGSNPLYLESLAAKYE